MCLNALTVSEVRCTAHVPWNIGLFAYNIHLKIRHLYCIENRRKPEIEIKEPLPEKIDLVLGNQIYIEKEGLPPSLKNRLIRLAAFQNPEFYKAQSMRLPTFGKPSELTVPPRRSSIGDWKHWRKRRTGSNWMLSCIAGGMNRHVSGRAWTVGSNHPLSTLIWINLQARDTRSYRTSYWLPPKLK